MSSNSIVFRTNLDEAQCEVRQLNRGGDVTTVPQIGSTIRLYVHTDRPFDLDVVAVVYDSRQRIYEVELHMPRHMAMQWTIKEWMEHMRRLRLPEDAK